MAETKALLIRGAKQLLTLRGPDRIRRGAECGELGILGDGSVLISGGLIACAGPSSRVDRLKEARGAEEFDAHGAAVLPAFTDALFHLPRQPERTLRQAALHGTAIFAVACGLAELRKLAGLPGIVPVVTGEALDAAEARRVRERFPVAFGMAGGALPPWHRAGLTVFGPEQDLDVDAAIESGAAMGTGFTEEAFQTWNMATAIGLACRAKRMTAAQAVTLTTANAAWAAGVGEALGRIQVGMRADLNILTVSDYRDIPHAFGANVVSRRVRAGMLVP